VKLLFALYTNTSLPPILASYWCQQHERFYSECVASSKYRIWVHHRFEISTLLGAPSVVQTNENHWGLNEGCEEDGS
jgi:hypothetical protein